MEAVVTSHEAKTKFGELLARVGRGEEIVITRNGVPAARIIPEGQAMRSDVSDWISGFLARREACRLNTPGEPKLSIRELIDEGRR